jgi:hypothetical protein
MTCDVTVRFFLKALWATASVSAICASVWAASPNDLITEGDAFDVKLQASEALEYYLPAEKLEPNNVRLLVRIARQYRHLMADAECLPMSTWSSEVWHHSFTVNCRKQQLKKR